MAEEKEEVIMLRKMTMAELKKAILEDGESNFDNIELIGDDHDFSWIDLEKIKRNLSFRNSDLRNTNWKGARLSFPSEGKNIHFEKADPGHAGLYPLINQLFARENFGRIKFINREQDLGLPGLRKAKESYFPHHLEEKYTIIPK